MQARLVSFRQDGWRRGIWHGTASAARETVLGGNAAWVGKRGLVMRVRVRNALSV